MCMLYFERGPTPPCEHAVGAVTRPPRPFPSLRPLPAPRRLVPLAPLPPSTPPVRRANSARRPRPFPSLRPLPAPRRLVPLAPLPPSTPPVRRANSARRPRRFPPSIPATPRAHRARDRPNRYIVYWERMPPPPLVSRSLVGG